MAYAKLRPLLAPALRTHNVAWPDMTAVLDTLGPSELREALRSTPEQWMRRLLQAVGPTATRLVLAQLRAVAQPELEKLNVSYPDVAQALETVDAAQLRAMVPRKYGGACACAQLDREAVASFLRGLLEELGPPALSMIVSQLRPLLEPRLAAVGAGLAWRDVRPALLLYNATALRHGLRQPERFAAQLVASARHGLLGVAARIVLARLRPVFEPILEEHHGLSWEDVLPALKLRDLGAEVEDALKDPRPFVAHLVRQAGPAPGPR